MTSQPTTIAVGTTNPAKLSAVERVAGDLFGVARVVPIALDLEIAAQPWGDDETAHGALTRAEAARARDDSQFGVGIESGLANGPAGRIYVICWAVVVDRGGNHGLGSGERFALPVELTAALRDGAELGPLLDSHFGLVNLSQHQGAVGLLTEGRRTRTDLVAVALLHAFMALLEPWRATYDSAAVH